MDQSNDTVIERVRVREVAGIFRSRDALDATVDALLESGFDRADIAVSSRYAAREKLGIDIPAEVIPEVSVVPRRPFFGPEDVTLVTGMGIGILIFAGAALGGTSPANWCCSCESVRPSAKAKPGRSSRRTERKRCGCRRSRSTSGCRIFR